MDYTISQVPTLISHIHTANAEFTSKRLSAKGSWSSSHGYILYLLAENTTLTMSQISRAINRDKSTTTVLVRKLLDEGLIKSSPSKNDSRVREISLTAKGRRLNELTAGISKELLEVCYKGFSAKEKQQLLSMLLKISENIDNSLK